MLDAILSAEDRLLLSATAPDSFAFEPGERDSLRWEPAFLLARANRVSGFLGALLEQGTLELPTDSMVHSRWRRLRGALAIQSELARRQLQALSQTLGDNGIPTLLYKGLDFETRFYPREGLRLFNDIDLMVHPGDALRADRELRNAGYALTEGSLPLDYYLRFHLHAVYRHPDRPLPVELHWALDSPYAGAETRLPVLLQAAQPATQISAGLLVPAPLDALALMALHLDKHLALCAHLPSREARLKSVLGLGGLVWLVDVACWFRSQGNTYATGTILERMRELDAESSLALALRLARDLDPAQLPSEVESLAAPPEPRSSVLARLVYPDLVSGRGVTPLGERRRARLMQTVPVLTFRPLRILELLFPLSQVRGSRLTRLPRVLALALANLLALVRFKLAARRS